jgi:hypothetical protein
LRIIKKLKSYFLRRRNQLNAADVYDSILSLKTKTKNIYYLLEPILEDLEMPHRYRPENLKMLCEATG